MDQYCRGRLAQSGECPVHFLLQPSEFDLRRQIGGTSFALMAIKTCNLHFSKNNFAVKNHAIYWTKKKLPNLYST